MDKLTELITYIDSKIAQGDCSRLGTVFETDKNKYFYDAGTGKVFACTDDEFMIFSYILEHKTIRSIISIVMEKRKIVETLETIKLMMDYEHILQMPLYDHFSPCSKEQIKKEVNKNFKQLILEVTQICNLRCGYCIYHDGYNGFRNFTNLNMTWEIAKKAIDYAFEHSDNKLAVTFYGGEPLVNYDLIKKCIEYCRGREKEKKEISYSFTTNLTLMTKEKAEYFASVNNCSLMGSIDGPKELHDRFRRTSSGLGSFDKAMEGLKYVLDAYGDKAKDLISINAVLAPPYSSGKFQRINEFFKEVDWIPDELHIHCTYMDPDTFEIAFPDGIPEINDKEQKNDGTLVDWAAIGIMDNRESKLQEKIAEKSLLKVHKRFITDKPIPYMNRNGCCIPGQRRLYVTADGQFRVCERVGHSPTIGNADEGVNLEKLYKYYIQSYQEEAVEHCRNCWCVHLCNMCYASYCTEDGIDFAKKFQRCKIEKETCKKDLIRYHKILENNPNWLERLNKIELI